MRIIRPGKSPEEKLLTGSCILCHCKVECERREAKHSPDPREPGLYVDCPTKGCTGTIWLKE